MMQTAVKTASILCVGNEWFPRKPGGLDRYVYELVHQLTLEGDRVELCGVDLPSLSDDAALDLVNLASPQRSLPQRLWSSQREFAQRSLQLPDAINLHFALYSLPLLSALPREVPVTFTFHGPWAAESAQEGHHPWNNRLKHWMEQRVYQRCDRFIVLSKAFGTVLNETYGIPGEKIHIIPGGVNTAHFRPTFTRQEAREKLDWPSDRQILFTPRRLVQRMGLDKLLQAMVTVKQQVPDVWLAIAGKGPRRPALEQQVWALGLEHQVSFLGFVPDAELPIAYQAADLTVVPSQSLEGFGLILVESLACGTPAFCTPVGGMPEVILPFAPNLVSESAEAGAIADQLITLLTGQVPLPARADCRAYAVQQFDWQRIAPQVRAVLLA
jgi:glycosyltransferase involved in cell wall biosynthesis